MDAEAVNDLRLNLWRATAPREALERAIACAEALDRVISMQTPVEAAFVGEERYRYLDRGIHRNEHITEIERALGLA